MLKLLTLCGLFHPHKCKVTDCMPNFRIFCIDLKLFYESLCSSLNKKAAKTTVFMEKNNDFVVRVTFGVIFEVDILCVIFHFSYSLF